MNFQASNQDMEGMGFHIPKFIKKVAKVVAAPEKAVAHVVANTGRAIVTKRPLRISAAIATGGLSTLATKRGRKEATHPTAIIHNVANVPRSAAHVVANTGRAIVTKRPLRIAAAIATGGLSTLATKKGRKEAVHLTEDVAHGAATAARFVGHEVAQGARVAERVARRIIMALAQKLLFKKPGMSGDAPATSAAAAAPLFSRTQAKALLIPPATAAVGSQVPAAAPAVPVLVASVIDELYKKVEAKIAKGLSPQQAQDAVAAEVNAAAGPNAYIWGGAALVAAAGLFFAFKPKRKA